MKYDVYMLGGEGYYVGSFTAVNADAGFGTWCWIRKADKRNYFYQPAK